MNRKELLKQIAAGTPPDVLLDAAFDELMTLIKEAKVESKKAERAYQKSRAESVSYREEWLRAERELNATLVKLDYANQTIEQRNAELSRRYADFMQVLTDSENQPSQFGTVTLEMYEKLELEKAELESEVAKAWSEAEIYRKGCAHHQHRVTYITDEIVAQFNNARKVYGADDVHVQGAFDYLQDSLHIQLNKGAY